MSETATSTMTVLFVDDDADAAELFTLFAGGRGHRVLHATSLAQGRTMLDEADVLVTDVELGDGSGLDLLSSGRPKRLRRAYIVSGYSHLESEAKKAGFDGTFTKPVDPDALLHTLEA
jgi:DNA-binding response OmpR family regulator